MRITQQIIVTALVLSVLAAPPVAAGIEGDFPEVVLFATSSMQIKAKAEVMSGDVVVNTDDAGTLSIENKAKTPAGWEVKADTLDAANNAALAGTEYCNGGNEAPCDGPLTTPVYAVLPLFKAASPFGGNVDVSNNGSEELSGDAQDVTIGNRGTLNITPGVHHVRSISAGNRANLVFSGPTELRVLENLDMGNQADINVGGPGASSVVIYVGGNATVGTNSKVNANIYAPTGTIDFPSKITATGAFLAEDLTIGSNGKVSLDSFFLNQPPVANADTATVDEDDPATTIDVLANDSDPNGDGLVIANVTRPPGGEAVITNLGADLTYQPNPDFCNDGSPTDDFTYEVCDDSTAINGNNCSIGTVQVTVNCINDAPTADPQDVVTDDQTPLVITLTGGDSDGDTLTFSIQSGPSLGALGPITPIVPGGGGPTVSATVTYTAGQVGNLEDSFVFRVTDPGGLFADATVGINPAGDPTPDPPGIDVVVAQDDTYEVAEGVTSTLELLGNAPVDLPYLVPLTFSVGTPSSGVLSGLTQGTEVPQRTATVDFTPSVAGTVTFDFTVVGDLNNDGDTADAGETDTATITIEVQPVAPPTPPVAEDQGYSTPQDTEVLIDLLGSPTEGAIGDCGRPDPEDCPGEGD